MVLSSTVIVTSLATIFDAVVCLLASLATMGFPPSGVQVVQLVEVHNPPCHFEVAAFNPKICRETVAPLAVIATGKSPLSFHAPPAPTLITGLLA